MQKIVKRYQGNASIVIPGGVKNVKVRTTKINRTFDEGGHYQLLSGGPSAFLDGAGNLFTMGLNANGELGDNTTTAKSSPTLVTGAMKWKAFTGNTNSVRAIDQAGNLWAWGANDVGQVDDSAVNKSSPVQVLPGLKWASVAPIGNSNFASGFVGIATNGHMYAGLGSTPSNNFPDIKYCPHPRSFGISPGGGGGNTFGIDIDGNAWISGDNTNGQCGIGTNGTFEGSPVQVIGGLKFKRLTYGQNNFVGITTGGNVYSWGLNDTGQLGIGSTADKSSPVLVLGGLSAKEAIYAFGPACFQVLTNSGTVYGWGQNFGYLGDGTLTNRSSPVTMAGGLKFRKIYQCYADGVTTFPNGDRTMAGGITLDGDLYLWGSSGNLNTVNGGTDIAAGSPELVVGGLKVADVGFCNNTGQFQGVGGFNHFLQTFEGLLYVCGNNTKGQIGDGTTTLAISPKLIAGALATNMNSLVETYNVQIPSAGTYALKMQQYNGFFGNAPIGEGPFEEVEIEYFV